MDPRIREKRQEELKLRDRYNKFRSRRLRPILLVFLAITVAVVYSVGTIKNIKAEARAEALAAGVPVVVTTEAPLVAPVVAAAEEVVCPGGTLESVREWCSLVNTEAKEYGLDPILILAVITQESGGQPHILSEQSAVGLMQIMPGDGYSSTIECANGPCFAARPTTFELFDPQVNVDYGCKMLAGLIQKYGSERDALKAYGPYNVGYYFADKVLAIKDALRQ